MDETMYLIVFPRNKYKYTKRKVYFFKIPIFSKKKEFYTVNSLPRTLQMSILFRKVWQ